MLMDLERQVSGWENIVVLGEVFFLRGCEDHVQGNNHMEVTLLEGAGML